MKKHSIVLSLAIAGLVTGAYAQQTANQVVKFNATLQNVNSQITDDGTNVGVDDNTPSYKLDVNGDINLSSGNDLRMGGSVILHNPGTNNTFLGTLTGAAHTTGLSGTFLGTNAGNDNTSGNYNSFIGVSAGALNTTGSYCTFTGASSGLNSNAHYNTFYGYNSGHANTSGQSNTIVGMQAGYSNTTGASNVFVGMQTGYSNSTASNNTFLGTQAGYTNTASANTYLGHHSGYSNSSGDVNTFTGRRSGFANTTGSNNCFYGSASGEANTTSSFNAFFGTNSGLVSTGGGNTFMGFSSGSANTTGTNNTYIGYNSGGTNVNTNSAAFGYNASVSASNSMVFGNSSVTTWGFGVNPGAGHALEVGSNNTNGNGAFLTTGGTWTNTSDRNKKENIVEVDGKDILARVNQLSITRWNYIGENPSFQHIGPMAQDFHKLFKVGHDDKSISTIDPAGIALVCVKELSKQGSLQTEEIEVLKTENETLRSELAAIKEQISLLDRSLAQCCTNHEATPGNDAKGAELEQNSPNPFNESTIIKYYVPQTAKEATINIYGNRSDLKATYGALVGNGQVIIAGGSLSAGTYTYSLVVDGVTVATKKMVLVK